jgi:hypothetical protein
MGDQPQIRRRFQFRLQTLMIGVAVVAVIAAVASRIIYERRMKQLIVGKWVCDYRGHKNGYSVVFGSSGLVNEGIKLPRPPLDRMGGHYSFNTADRTVRLTIEDDSERPSRFEIIEGRLTDDDILVIDENRPLRTKRLRRDTIGVWAQ